VTPAERAAAEYLARRAGSAVPSGRLDCRGRWVPDPAERRPCCDRVRVTVRAPRSAEGHARGAAHVAALHGVTVADLRAAAQHLREAS
jgi:hypothetical protein